MIFIVVVAAVLIAKAVKANIFLHFIFFAYVFGGSGSDEKQHNVEINAPFCLSPIWLIFGAEGEESFSTELIYVCFSTPPPNL